MSTPFLKRFAEQLVQRLVAEGLLEVVDGGSERVAANVAAHLGGIDLGSLVPAVSRALVTSPAVVDLFADDEALHEVIVGLGPRAVR